MKPKTNTKKCKCGNKLYYRNGLPVSKMCLACRKKKKLAKVEKFKTTKKYAQLEIKKFIKENDRLYQEVGRLKYKTCYFGHSYYCLHHFIRKSQSLFTRYNFDNGIPICMSCHCLIHQGQDSTLEAKIVLDKGKEWLDKLVEGKHKIVINKLEFLKEKNEYLKKQLSL